jgi:antitoxin CcdA
MTLFHYIIGINKHMFKISLNMNFAKRLKVKISLICGSHLRKVVRKKREEHWRKKHTKFTVTYNAIVEREGLPLDEWRTF